MSIIPFAPQSPFDSRMGGDGRWSARSLQSLMGYSRWENLAPALTRAVTSARNEGLDVEDHFLRCQENPSELGGRPREDFRLTRHAAYLLAMNGDPNKQEVADAQAYFARKTREAETSTAALPQDYEQALVALLGKVRETKALEGRVAELEPSAAAWDVLASGDGDYSVGDAAKILSRDPAIETGRNRLFGILHELDWAYVQNADHRYRAKQYAVERRWLSELPQSYTHPRTGELTLGAPQLRVTAKGIAELHRRLGGSGPVQIPAAAIEGGVR